MKTLAERLDEQPWTTRSDDAIFLRIVKEWLEEQKKEFRKQEPQPTGEWLTLYGAKLRVYTDLIKCVQNSDGGKQGE